MRFMQYFGVDRHTIKSLKVRSIDFEKLGSRNNARLSYQGNVRIEMPDRTTGEIKSFSNISITNDKRFGSLTIGCKSIGKGRMEYITLDVFISEENGNNLIPLTVEQVVKKHEELIIYINEMYGIELTNTEEEYKYLEMNGTVALEFDSGYYQGLMELLQYTAPKRYDKKNENNIEIYRDSEDGQLNFIAYKNDSMRLKMYNKTRHLEQRKGIKLYKVFFRIEVCLNTAKKIRSVFGTDRVSEITDEMMKEYFIKVVKKDVFDRVEEYLKKSNKAIEERKKELKEANTRTWTKDMFGICGEKMKFENKTVDLVFDLEQIINSIKKDTKRADSFKRTMKRCEVVMKGKEHKKNNLNAYEEIKTKFLEF